VTVRASGEYVFCVGGLPSQSDAPLISMMVSGVSTRSTPGAVSAARVSIARTVPAAMVASTITACASPSSCCSKAYLAAPVILAGPSTRDSRPPTAPSEASPCLESACLVLACLML
jgi:hypothetical protein